MSGATGAGSSGSSSGPSTGTDKDGGGRGSAARATDAQGARDAHSATDPHTTNLQAIRPRTTGKRSPDTHGSKGSQGGTVTDARGPQTQQYGVGAGPAAQGAPGSLPVPEPAAQRAAAPPQQQGSPLPGERQPQQPAGPYHPPQAYPTAAPAGPAAPVQAQAGAGAVRRPRTGARTLPRTRKARLRVSKADPWSVMKVSFLLSIALGICTIVAAVVLWMVMDAMGVFSTVGGTISEATGSNESNGFDLQSFLSLQNVVLFTSVIAVIDVVLATALATLGAFIYNLSAGFVGGIELTLAEDE
ncbi:DUF3566 domain-containing protein [Streptomyces sp. ADMS]|uniref:DUF3566 domain-containing protein n=1 Tax=Streptomyces sp. ADMS TaxID=3071415 RepID=UPI00296FAFC4|nr:DUF3566 domain-containing protein [Streptomyces sp. ADMS]MDW4904679.1 DUF3566 domain-containing protein [Streptomyces sp. ADMS]